MKVIVFGLGGVYERYKYKIKRYFKIIGYMDSDNLKKNKLNKNEVFINKNELNNYDYDFIFIVSNFYDEIKYQLINEYNVCKEK